MSSSNCCFLTCIQISQEAVQVVWHSHLFQNFPQFIVIHTVKGFGIVNKAEIDVFLELSCFFHDPADVGNLISGSSTFSESSVNIRKFMVHVLLKPGLENFEHYFTSVWDEHNCAIVWAFFGNAFLWDWNENWPFPVQWPLLSFPNLLAYWVQHFHKGFGVVNKAEVNIFLELFCFFNDPVNVDNLISGSSAFSKTSLNIWKFTYCWSLAWRILSITVLACEMSATVR